MNNECEAPIFFFGNKDDFSRSHRLLRHEYDKNVSTNDWAVFLKPWL